MSDNDPKVPGVELVRGDDELVLLSNQELIPITSWYDEQGVQVATIHEATACVAGPSSLGKWYAIRLDISYRFNSAESNTLH